MKILKNSKEADIIASIRTLLDELARHISSDALTNKEIESSFEERKIIMSPVFLGEVPT